MKLLVTGGWFDDSGEGALFQVDLATGRPEEVLRWHPPEHLRVPAKGFAGGCLGPDGKLYLAAHAAVVRVDPRRWRVTGLLHHPSFNDLHHVAADRGRLYVTNTGLSTIEVFSLAGDFLGSYNMLPAWVNCRRMDGGDPPSWPQVLRRGWIGDAPGKWEYSPKADGYHDDRHRRSTLPFHRLKLRDYLHPNHACITPRQSLVTCLYDGSVRDLRDWSVV